LLPANVTISATNRPIATLQHHFCPEIAESARTLPTYCRGERPKSRTVRHLEVYAATAK